MELGKGRKAMGLGIIVCFGLVTMLLKAELLSMV
jgi:hypothetical protein